MGERREKEERETYIIKSRRKNIISLSSYCYYYGLQKPLEFAGAVRRAVLRCLRFGKTQTPACASGDGGLGGGDPTSMADDPPTSTRATSVTVMRSYEYDATLIRSRNPPTPPVSSGRPPQIN